MASVVTAPVPAVAKILKTRPTASEAWSPLLPLTIGSGLEIQSDSDQTQYDFPFLVEYNLTETLQFIIEPDVVYIQSKTQDVKSVVGFGNLETAVEYEFVRERRYRPALSAETAATWGTATDPDIGSTKNDYSLGVIASKDFVFADFDLNVLYTFVGERNTPNSLEIGAATEWPLSYFIAVEAELIYAPLGTGIVGQPGTITNLGGKDEFEGTLGLAENVNKYLKLEEGIIGKSDQSWQFVFAWEYRFSGD